MYDADVCGACNAAVPVSLVLLQRPFSNHRLSRNHTLRCDSLWNLVKFNWTLTKCDREWIRVYFLRGHTNTELLLKFIPINLSCHDTFDDFFFFPRIFGSFNCLLHSNDGPAVSLTFVLLTQLTWTKQVHRGSHFLLQVHATLKGLFVTCHACMLEQQIVHLWFNTTDCLHIQAGSHDWFWARSTFTWSKLGKLRSRLSAFMFFCTSVAKRWDSLSL